MKLSKFRKSHLFFGASVGTPSAIPAEVTGVSAAIIEETSYEDVPDSPEKVVDDCTLPTSFLPVKLAVLPLYPEYPEYPL